MGNKGKRTALQIRLTGKTGEIDGFMEMFVGMLLMTGVLIEVKKSMLPAGEGMSRIYLDVDLLPPPLGNLGEDDLPVYSGDNP